MTIHPSAMWLYAAECDEGGISAWKTAEGNWHAAYPEVTGYLLPTLTAWGAQDLADRCALWLLSVQNKDGSWNGLDGAPRPFDTAAIVQGLQSLGDEYFNKSINMAVNWLETQIAPEGYLYNSPRQQTPEIYNLRASAIIGNDAELDYWKQHGLNQREQRAHYLAYALEGALNINPLDAWAQAYIEMAYHTQTGFMPFYVRPDWRSNHVSFDYCATAQMGLLYERVGLDASKTLRLLRGAVQNGGLAQSNDDPRQIAWAVKFYLDLEYALND